jgi:hypothetical protein
MKRRLFLFEKPSQMEAFFKNGFLEKNDFAVIAPSYLSYYFDYDQKTTNKITNYIPRYILNKKSYGCNDILYSFENKIYKKKFKLFENIINENKNIREKSLKKIKLLINNVDEIYCACDSGFSGTRGFDFKMEKYFDINILENSKKTYYIDMYFEPTPNKNSLLLDNEKYIEGKNSYIKKDYFNYNFNINSFKYYTAYIKKKGILMKKPLTINMILVLLIIKNHIFYEYDLFEYMAQREIGTFAFKDNILEELILYKLVEKKSDLLFLTHVGADFLKDNIKENNFNNIGINLCSNISDNFYNLEMFKEKYNKILINIFKKNGD